MTLKDLVEAYDGKIVFNVLQATLGGKEEIIDFSSEDNKAIKDEILSQNVQNYTVEVSNNVRPTVKITVVLEGVVSSDPSGDPSDPPSSDPSDPSGGAGGSGATP